MEPARREVRAPESRPECGTGLADGWVQRTREVIDVPPAPVEVTEHVLVARMCPICERRRVPRLAPDGVAVGRQRLGVDLMSLIATLREEARLPVRTIQSYLWTVHQLKLSTGAIVGVIHRVARPARPAVADMPERIRGSPVVHADETGPSRSRQGGRRRGAGRVLQRGAGKRLLRRLRPLPRPQAAVLGTSAAGQTGAQCVLPRRSEARSVERSGQAALPQGQLTRRPRAGARPPAADLPRPVEAGGAVAVAVPPLPVRPGGAAGQTLPAHRTIHQGTVRLRVGPRRAAR